MSPTLELEAADPKALKKYLAARKAFDAADNKLDNAMFGPKAREEKARAARNLAQKALDAALKEMPVIGALKLRRTFDRYAHIVLGDGYLDQLPRERGAMRRYVVLKPLPSSEEYTKLRNEKYTMTLEDLVSAAQSDLESLGDELRQWHDNMPESFQNADKGSEVEEAASAMETAAQDMPDVPASLAKVRVVHLPGETSSRSDRCAECCSMLNDAIDRLKACMVEFATKPEVEAEIKELVDGLEGIVNDAENVTFPGMY